MKTCSTCLVPQHQDSFHSRRASLDGLSPNCKQCAKVIGASYRKANPEKCIALQKAWRAANHEKKKAHDVKYRAVNQGVVKASQALWQIANPGVASARAVVWNRANITPEKGAANASKRRARKLNATPAWANDFFIEEIYDLAQRRTKATGVEWHVDHYYPLQSKWVCGLHVESNLQVIPASMNQSKGNRRLDGFSPA